MGDETNFSEKWDFRRKEHSFDDSSSDDPDSNSIIHNPNIVQDLNQIDNGTQTVTREQKTAKTRKRRSKKDESKPEKAKQVKGRKTVSAEENEKKEEEETVMGMDSVGMFMNTLLDDLTASRESLMDWVKTELYGTSDQNVASRPPLKKKAVAAQRSVKKTRMTKEEQEKKESKKQSKPQENGQEMNEPKQKSPKIAQDGNDQVQEHDCNAGPLDRFLKNGQGGLGRNYFQQQEEVQSQTETKKSQKSVVLAIEAQTLCQRRKQRREANTTTKNRLSMVETKGSETQKDHNSVMPFAPKLASPSQLQSFPVSYPLNSLFACSSQGVTSLENNSKYQMRQPVAQIPNHSEFQTGVTGGQGFGNGYFSGLTAALQPNLIGTGYNFPAQVNPAISSQQRDNNNMFGGLRMAGGAITFSSKRFSEAEVANGIDRVSNYRTSSGR